MSLDYQKFNCVVSDINSVTKALDIVVSKESFLKTYQNVLNNTASRAKINGFRPGKAPKSMIESMYKQAIIADAKEKLLQESIDSSIRENNLKVISVTNVDFKEDTQEDGFSFCATVEVFPSLPEVPSYEGLDVVVEKDEYSEDKLNQAIDELVMQFSKLEPVSGRDKANESDTVKFDFSVEYPDGSSEDTREIVREFSPNAWSIEGSSSFDNEVRNLLLNMKVGETKDCKSSIKISNSKGEFEAGDVTYKVTLKEILEKRKPELTDEFVKSMPGYELNSVNELQDRMRDVLQSEILKANDNRMKMAVMHKLLESYDFEIPQTMLDQEIENMLAMQSNQYVKAISLSKVKPETRDHIRRVYDEPAKERIKIAFLIDAIVKNENIEVTDVDYNSYIEKIANETLTSIDKINNDIKTNNLKTSIMLELRRTKAWELLCSKANISYVALGEGVETPSKKTAKKSTKKVAESAEAAKEEKVEGEVKKTTRKSCTKKAKDEAVTSDNQVAEEVVEAPKAKRGRKKKEEA